MLGLSTLGLIGLVIGCVCFGVAVGIVVGSWNAASYEADRESERLYRELRCRP